MSRLVPPPLIVFLTLLVGSPAVAPGLPMGRPPVVAAPPLPGLPARSESSPGGGSLSVAAAPAFGWPLDGRPSVVRRFDPPPRPWLPGHRGVDLASEPGAVVRAAGAGVVFFAGRIAGRGVVTVGHSGGLRTTYEPVEPTVRVGDAVDAGAEIGLLAAGHSGCPVDACLHWGLRRGSTYLDPLALLALGRVRLLPLRPRG